MEDQIKKHPSNKTYFPRYFVTKLFAIIIVPALLGGCAGMMSDALYHNAVTGDTYGSMKDTFPSPIDGTGRMFIYRTAASTKTSYGIGPGGSMKSRAWCDLDGKEFLLVWEAFFYIDLPEGEHQLSCPSNYMYELYTKGKDSKWRNITPNRINFSVNSSMVTFIRLDATEFDEFLFQPIVVDAENGQAEINDLDLLEKKHRRRYN